MTMPTRNLVNLEKISEMSPIKGEFLASHSKQTFDFFSKELKKFSN